MTDRQYECILAIADEGTISGAAKKMYVSQSSLSQMLMHVEAELGTPLFIRSTSGMVLTYSGVLYIDAVRQLLLIMRGLKNRIEEMKDTDNGKISVGIATKRSWLLMPFVLPAYMKAFPGVEIVFVEEDQCELDKLILQGKIDIAFTTKTYPSKDIVYEHIYDEYLLLILPKEFYLLNDDREVLTKKDFEQLEGMPFILTREGHEIRKMINSIFSDFSFEPHVLLESHSMDVCFQIAAAGLGATIIPDTLRKVYASKHKVNWYKIAEKYHRNVAMMYHRDMYLSFIMRNFIDISKKTIISNIVNNY